MSDAAIPAGQVAGATTVQTQITGSLPTESLLNRGGTVSPVYGQRRPKMFHLFQNEVTSISSLNSTALAFFSIGAFLASIVLSIIVGYGFAAGPLSEFGKVLCHQGAWAIGVLSAIFYGWGGYMVYVKKTIVDQIKKETEKDH